MISITKSAESRLKTVLSDEKVPSALRIMVEPGGCNGRVINLDIVPVETLQDFEIIENNGAVIAIDDISTKSLRNATLDYTEELAGSKFQIIPEGTSTCSCGSSFAAMPK